MAKGKKSWQRDYEKIPTKKDDRTHVCPECGKWGKPSFTRFFCSNGGCKNYDYETYTEWCRLNGPNPFADLEDTIKWNF